MCGIFGYVGERKDAVAMIREGLKRLEYRGYDSWGIAFPKDEIQIFKEVGRVPDSVDNVSSSIALGHTRWATHGGVSVDNAHPHLSSDKKIAVVHNGIIENYQKIILKYNLYVKSQTDSEVIPLLIEYLMEQSYSFEEAVRQTLAELEGTFGRLKIAGKNARAVKRFKAVGTFRSIKRNWSGKIEPYNTCK